MKVLMTGAGGFIGRHLDGELTTHGYQVDGIDRAEGDLTEPGVFAGLFRESSPDLVIHLAAQVGRLLGEEDLAYTVTSNATMTAFVARVCGKAGVPLLYASTSEVYGDQGDAVCREDGPMVLPHNLYGLSKRWGEEAARLYAPEGLKVCRFSMPYGPGAPPGRGRRAMDNMLWQAHHLMPITVHMDSERSWCWVGDVAHGVRLVIEKGAPGAYNIGRDDQPRSMLDIAFRACQIAGAPAGELVRLVPAPKAQTAVKRLDTEKLRRLGWRPRVGLDAGMQAVYEWVKRFDAQGRLAA